ncbi:phosphotransferase [Reinekea sp.]|jgi:thiamine kinase|uniref:phosphotransferase n=1 Tax=Reinekea sp. TaxID=1970455 RepID=UPI002A8252E1|nr:phosphotransferase [Reinekea sp.]
MQLHQALPILRDIIGDTVQIRRVPTGLTNAVYQLTTPDRRWALRINNPQGHRLGINRARERDILAHIQGQSWAPVVGWASDQLLLTEWHSGANYKPSSAERVERLCALIEAIHGCTGHLLVDQPSLLVPDQIQLLLDQAGAVDPAFQSQVLAECERYQAPDRLVLCHHDWHPGNLIHQQGQLLLLDWEYAAPGDARLDLACLLSGFNLSGAQQQQVLERFHLDPDTLLTVQCLADAMALLWYRVRCPTRPYLAEQHQWAVRWQTHLGAL